MIEQLEHCKGDTAKYEEWFDATSESSFHNTVSQIQLFNPSVPLRLDLLSMTRVVEGGRLVEVLGFGEKVEVMLGPSRGNE